MQVAPYTEDEVERALAEKSLYHFVQTSWHCVYPFTAYQDNWLIGCVCEHLQALSELQIKRLVINCPPRHSKSSLVSVFWFCWSWLREPHSQWIFASYDANLALRDSLRCRDVIRLPWFRQFFNFTWKLKYDQDTKGWFNNDLGGTRRCTTSSPDAGGTGFDADYLVADDANSVGDAGHRNRLQKVADWWGKTMATRGNEPANLRKCIIQQRVDEYDLTGHVRAKELGYECLVIPMEHEPKRHYPTWEAAREARERHPIVPTRVQQASPSARDPRAQEGEVIWPERFTPEVVAEWKAELGPTGVAGQLQQRPQPAEGTIFRQETFRRFHVGFRDYTQEVPKTRDEYTYEEAKKAEAYPLFSPSRVVTERLECVIFPGEAGERFYPLSLCRFFQTADTAMTENTKNDPTAVGTYAITPDGDLLIWDVFRDWLEIPYQFPALVALYSSPCAWDKEQRRCRPLGSWPRPLLFQAVENKSSGIGLIQQGAARGHPFKVLNAGKADKVERAGPLATAYHNGKVWHRDGAAWLPWYEDELLSFPSGAHDEAVDVSAYAAQLLQHDAILRAYQSGEVAYVSDEAQEAVYADPLTQGHLERQGDDVIIPRPQDVLDDYV